MRKKKQPKGIQDLISVVTRKTEPSHKTRNGLIGAGVATAIVGLLVKPKKPKP